MTRKTFLACCLLIQAVAVSGCSSLKVAAGLDDKYSTLLAQHDWRVESVRGAEAIGPPPLAIHFDGARTISGFSGCGAYTANYWIRGNRMDISAIEPKPSGSCDTARLTQEAELFNGLKWMRRVKIEDDGSVLLKARGGSPLKLVPGS